MRSKTIRWLLMLGVLTGRSESRAEAIRVGAVAPNFVGTTLSGQQVRLQNLRGHPVLISFISGWCEPCRTEIPRVLHYVQQHSGQMTWLVVSMDDEDENQTLRHLLGASGNNLIPSQRAQYEGYGRIWRLPVSFLIDAKGRLRVNGWDSSPPEIDEKWMERWVTPLLGHEQSSK